MTAITGATNVLAPIRPTSTLQTFSTSYADEAKGGYHIKETTTLRNTIPYDRRKIGMVCRVLADGKLYRLISDPGSGNTTDSNWKEDTASASTVTLDNGNKDKTELETVSTTSKTKYIMSQMEVDGK